VQRAAGGEIASYALFDFPPLAGKPILVAFSGRRMQGKGTMGEQDSSKGNMTAYRAGNRSPFVSGGIKFLE